ncbi:MAG: RNA-binding protein [Litoreibacter sp.]|nr:RNA-binding protein [Litoreibacter sp.]MCY4336894.1 RNA-binding protein [Litoreibacter sp.]
MSRGGRDKTRDGPERRCIATGEIGDPARLIRFVVGPDGEAVPDITGKLPGRGMWVSADKKALELAIKKNAFSRSAKTQVKVPEGLFAQTEALLAKRLVDLISLARKAGQAIAGYEKVKGWLETDRARLLIQASDGSERGKSKLHSPPGKDVFVGSLTAQELGLAFGRESVIHGAVTAGGLGKQIKAEAIRLKGVRGMTSGKKPSNKEKTTHER